MMKLLYQNTKDRVKRGSDYLEEKIPRIYIVLTMFVFKMIAELSYVFQVSPTYSYLSLTLNENIKKMVLSYLIFLLMVILIPNRKKSPSTYLLNILFALMWIPISSYYWLNNQSSSYFFMFSFCFSLLFFVRKIRIEPVILNDKKISVFFDLLFIVYMLICVYLVFKAGGIDLRSLNFDSVYEVRFDNRISGISGYLLNWSSKVFFPFYSAYFIEKKKYVHVFITISSQLLLYLTYGNKAFLFSIFFVYFCILLLNKDLWIKYFPNMITFSIMLSFILKNFRLGDILVRTIPYRLLFVPAQIQFWYYDYFSTNPKLLYGETFLGPILGTQKTGPSTSLLINKHFTNISIESNANTGVFSDAFSNGGFTAMLVTSIVLLLILLLIDSFERKISTTLLVASFSYSMFILNDTSLLTSLNTGGIIILLFMFFLYSPKKIEGFTYD